VSLTRRDFEAIASQVKRVRDGNNLSGPEALAMDRIILAVSYGLAETNPRFNQGRFLEASGHNE
jgi:hypothetical protein